MAQDRISYWKGKKEKKKEAAIPLSTTERVMLELFVIDLPSFAEYEAELLFKTARAKALYKEILKKGQIEEKEEEEIYELISRIDKETENIVHKIADYLNAKLEILSMPININWTVIKERVNEEEIVKGVIIRFDLHFDYSEFLTKTLEEIIPKKERYRWSPEELLDDWINESESKVEEILREIPKEIEDFLERQKPLDFEIFRVKEIRRGTKKQFGPNPQVILEFYFS